MSDTVSPEATADLSSLIVLPIDPCCQKDPGQGFQGYCRPRSPHNQLEWTVPEAFYRLLSKKPRFMSHLSIWRSPDDPGMIWVLCRCATPCMFTTSFCAGPCRRRCCIHTLSLKLFSHLPFPSSFGSCKAVFANTPVSFITLLVIKILSCWHLEYCKLPAS